MILVSLKQSRDASPSRKTIDVNLCILILAINKAKL